MTTAGQAADDAAAAVAAIVEAAGNDELMQSMLLPDYILVLHTFSIKQNQIAAALKSQTGSGTAYQQLCAKLVAN